MNKTDIIRNFSKLKGALEKENFLKNNNVTFTHDSYQNLVIWCKDGILTLTPKRK